MNKTTNTRTKNDFGTYEKQSDLKVDVCSTNIYHASRSQIIYPESQDTNQPHSFGYRFPLNFEIKDLLLTSKETHLFLRTQHFLKWWLLTEAYQPQAFQNLFNSASRPSYPTQVCAGARGLGRNTCLSGQIPATHSLSLSPVRLVATSDDLWSMKYHTSMDGTLRNITVFLIKWVYC